MNDKAPDNKDPVFIEILRFGAERGIKTVRFEDLIERLENKNYLTCTPDDTMRSRILDWWTECFLQDHRSNGCGALKTEYFFRLIEYQELQLARTAAEDAQINAKKANRNSFIAISISVSAVIIGIIVSVYQTSQPMKLDTNQANKIHQALISISRTLEQPKHDKNNEATDQSSK